MSQIFNPLINMEKCSICDGSSILKNEFNQIIYQNNSPLKCSCFLPKKYIEANIGYDYWTIGKLNWKGSDEDLNYVINYGQDLEKNYYSGQGFFFTEIMAQAKHL